MKSLSNIRDQLQAYAAKDKCGYEAFRKWFVPVYAEHMEAGESEALGLCRAIEWELADYSEALIGEPELKKRLALLIDFVQEEDSKTSAASVAITRIFVMGHQISNTPAVSRNASLGGISIVPFSPKNLLPNAVVMS